MMNQPQLLDLEVLRCRCRIDVEAGEGKHPGALPLVNGGFDLRSPEKIRLLRGPCAVVGNSDIVVRATDLVLCAVAAEQMSEARTGTKMRHGTVPLGEVLIASDMTTFAGSRSAFLRVQTFPAYAAATTYQASQPLRDLVWLRRGGPPPGPAIARAFELELTRQTDTRLASRRFPVERRGYQHDTETQGVSENQVASVGGGGGERRGTQSVRWVLSQPGSESQVAASGIAGIGKRQTGLNGGLR
jgi:hypothetical protein